MFVSPRLMYRKVQDRFFTELFNKEIKYGTRKNKLELKRVTALDYRFAE